MPIKITLFIANLLIIAVAVVAIIYFCVSFFLINSDDRSTVVFKHMIELTSFHGQFYLEKYKKRKRKRTSQIIIMMNVRLIIISLGIRF